MKTMYGLFSTDKSMEREGIYIDYGSFRVKIARAGGDNKEYAKSLERKTRPYRRAIQMDSMDNDVAMTIMREVFANTVVLNWEVKQEDDEWLQGIEGPEGDLLPFSTDQVLDTFEKLPDLFMDIQQQANHISLFREEELGKDAGN